MSFAFEFKTLSVSHFSCLAVVGRFNWSSVSSDDLQMDNLIEFHDHAIGRDVIQCAWLRHSEHLRHLCLYRSDARQLYLYYPILRQLDRLEFHVDFAARGTSLPQNPATIPLTAQGNVTLSGMLDSDLRYPLQEVNSDVRHLVVYQVTDTENGFLVTPYHNTLHLFLKVPLPVALVVLQLHLVNPRCVPGVFDLIHRHSTQLEQVEFRLSPAASFADDRRLSNSGICLDAIRTLLVDNLIPSEFLIDLQSLNDLHTDFHSLLFSCSGFSYSYSPTLSVLVGLGLEVTGIWSTNIRDLNIKPEYSFRCLLQSLSQFSHVADLNIQMWRSYVHAPVHPSEVRHISYAILEGLLVSFLSSDYFTVY